MRLFNEIVLACAWVAILATAPYVYSHRNTMDAWSVLLYLGLVLIVGLGTIFLFISLFDRD